MRTSLSILGLSAACLRWLPQFGSVALIGPSVAAVLVVAVTVYERRSRPRRLAQFSAERQRPLWVWEQLSRSLCSCSVRRGFGFC
ncbi:hypothetical protein ACETU7_25035 [Rhodococcus sp. 3Y1]